MTAESVSVRHCAMKPRCSVQNDFVETNRRDLLKGALATGVAFGFSSALEGAGADRKNSDGLARLNLSSKGSQYASS